jgi:hypothetical protein
VGCTDDDVTGLTGSDANPKTESTLTILPRKKDLRRDPRKNLKRRHPKNLSLPTIILIMSRRDLSKRAPSKEPLKS